MENKTAAVICEYNPFHYGHKHQLDELHEKGYNVISIMSGNTVQRGDVALFEKYSRARTALCNGADVVVELPFPYSMTSAVDFARSGVAIAKGLGVDALAFGCESPELVFELARFLSGDIAKTELKTIIAHEKNISMPKARQKLVAEKLGVSYAEAIKKPNNILAIEYIIACDGELEPIALLRDQTKLSATYLRSLECDDMMTKLPPMSDGVKIDGKKLDCAVLSKLRMMSADDLGKIYDTTGGTEYRLKKAAFDSNSIDELVGLLINADTTTARAKRLIRNAFFGVAKECVHTPPQYTVLLGAKKGKTSLLSHATIPIITRTSDSARLGSDTAKSMYRAHVTADSVVALAFGERVPFYPTKCAPVIIS